MPVGRLWGRVWWVRCLDMRSGSGCGVWATPPHRWRSPAEGKAIDNIADLPSWTTTPPALIELSCALNDPADPTHEVPQMCHSPSAPGRFGEPPSGL